MSKELHQKTLSNMELATFCEQMSVTLASGISATEGVRILTEEAEGHQEQELMAAILEHLENFETFYESLKAVKVFPAYMLSMVHIAEETGKLDEVMSALSQHYEREETISRTIKHAITFPIVMSAMMIIVIIVLLVKVMPVFNQVYAQLGTELTGVSRMLLNIGNAIGKYAVVIIVAAAVLVLLALILTRTDKGRKALMNLSYKTGLGRKTQDDVASMRFAGAMSLLLSSGIDAERSLELAGAVNETPQFQKKLERCKEMMAEGISMEKAVFETGIFYGSYARMLSVGAKAGAADQMMERIADLYQETIDSRLSSRLAKLEPTMVIVLSLIVGLILLSVMLPLMGIMSGI